MGSRAARFLQIFCGQSLNLCGTFLETIHEQRRSIILWKKLIIQQNCGRNNYRAMEMDLT
jgi:hypothetical protein